MQTTDREAFDRLLMHVSTDRLLSVSTIAANAGMPADQAGAILGWGRVRGLIAYDHWHGSEFYYRRSPTRKA